MRYLRKGIGKPLLLIHGLGGNWRSWNPILKALATEREIFAVNLPGFGSTPPLPGKTSIATLADSVADFLEKQDLLGIDAVGSGMGARIALELVQRERILGGVVALAPSGFLEGWERAVFHSSLALSVRVIRRLDLLLPIVSENSMAKTLLFSQLSTHPSRITAQLALNEMRNYAYSPSFDEALNDLAYGNPLRGRPRGSLSKPLVIGWGHQDRVCPPVQAKRVRLVFPDSRIHWFENCGHFPQWDAPEQTVKLIFDTLGKKHLHTIERIAA